MNLLGKKILNDFKESHADARSNLEAWETEIEDACWHTPHDLKARYPKASLVKNQQVFFDVCGNKYRLLVKVNYKNQIVLIKKIGTHDEYNKWILD